MKRQVLSPGVKTRSADPDVSEGSGRRVRSLTRTTSARSNRSRVGKVLTTTIDHGSLSLMAFGLAMAVAQASSVSQFGRFSLVQAFTWAGVAGFRALPATWMLTAHHFEDESSIPRVLGSGAVSLALGAGLIWGLSASLLIAVIEGSLWALLGGTLLPPAMLSVEALRYRQHREGRHQGAMWLSMAVLASGTLSLILAARFLDLSDWGATYLVFATAYAGVAVIGIARVGACPSFGAFMEFLHLGRHDWRASTLNFLTIMARQVSVVYAVAGVAGLAVAGGLRGAQAIAGLPLQVSMGMQPLFLSAASRRLARTSIYSNSLTFGWFVSQSGLLLSCAVASFFVPDWMGEMILGATWESASIALPWVLFASWIAQLVFGFETYLRLVGQLGILARIRVVTLALTLACAMSGGVLDGVRGAAIGIVVGNSATLCLAAVRKRQVRARLATDFRG